MPKRKPAKRSHKVLDREPAPEEVLRNLGTSEQPPSFCNDGPLDGVEDDEEEEGHEEWDDAP